MADRSGGFSRVPPVVTGWGVQELAMLSDLLFEQILQDVGAPGTGVSTGLRRKSSHRSLTGLM